MSIRHTIKCIRLLQLSIIILLVWPYHLGLHGYNGDDVSRVNLSVSPSYPTIGQPSVISLVLRFSNDAEGVRCVKLIDVFTGFVVKDNTVMRLSGNVTLECFNISIKGYERISKRIVWYPVIPGMHRLVCLVDSDIVGCIDVDVGFCIDQIVYPSLGCPSIISKDKGGFLFVLLSEEHDDVGSVTNIDYLSLRRVNDSVSYTLYDGEVLSVDRIRVDAGRFEDETMVRYNVSSITPGFYDLSVKTSKNNYTWRHAVKIIDYTPYSFSFVQLSDIHIGKQYNGIDEKAEVIRSIRYINEYIRPDFIVLSGDMIDWSNKRTNYRSYLDLQDVIMNSSCPVYTIPGNHERYNNRLMLLYMPYTNLTPYHIFINPIGDYSFVYSGCNMVFLDSGYDHSRFEVKKGIWNQTPESSGLSNTQMYLLEDVYTRDDTGLVIIIMHHPAVNIHNDTGLNHLPNTLTSGNDECIAFNRGLFIDYCINRNISMVLSGHTHRNHVLDYNGKEVNYTMVSSPLFIQTDSATLKGKGSGGRVITIENSSIVSYSYQSIP